MLTHSEFLSLATLTHAELQTYLYLQTLDPFGDGLETDVATIAEALGRHRATINSALNTLKNNGFIQHTFKRARRILCQAKQALSPTKSPTTETISVSAAAPAKEQSSLPQETYAMTQTQDETKKFSQNSTRQAKPINNSCRVQTTIKVPARQAEYTDNNQALEPIYINAFKAPKTYSDYLKLVQTIPDLEREKFLNFCEKKAIALPKPVQMLDKWIASNFDWLKSQFYKTTTKETTKPEAKNKPKLTPKQESIVKDLLAAQKIKQLYYSESFHRWQVVWANGAVCGLDEALSSIQYQKSERFVGMQALLQQTKAKLLGKTLDLSRKLDISGELQADNPIGE